MNGRSLDAGALSLINFRIDLSEADGRILTFRTREGFSFSVGEEMVGEDGPCPTWGRRLRRGNQSPAVALGALTFGRLIGIERDDPVVDSR
jgi:hypothetical protein